jgi:hypothetical protein
MWTTDNRSRYDRDNPRYPGDLNDAEWRKIGPLITPAKRGEGKRTVNMRDVVSAPAPGTGSASSPGELG